MTEPLQREEIIELLNSLGSEDDAEVLEAARGLHGKVSAAGTSWEALLVPEAAEEVEEVEEAEPAEPADVGLEEAETEADDQPPEPEEPGGSTPEKDAEALALIEKLLARKNISDDFRDELKGYKTDIAEGEFNEADHRYIRAVFKRLNS